MKKYFVAALLACSVSAGAQTSKIKIALNWKPEPQFGGFYAADVNGHFLKAQVPVELMVGGAGAPVSQLVASGKVEFGVVTGDEVVVGQERGLDLVALYASYQTFPQGIMVHKSRGLKSLAEVFAQDGTLAMQKGVPYTLFLEKKFSQKKVKIVPYVGGIAQFQKDTNFAQQCFVTSEPLSAEHIGADPQTFLIAEAGYNPYTTVLVARRDYVEHNRVVVEKVVKALRAGWEDYLKAPKETNLRMQALNPSMDLATFDASAKAQLPLVRTEATQKAGLGTMTEARWTELAKQLYDLKVIAKPHPGARYFQNF
ncbi:MAG: ABC transporter substrate-binding protein [Bdellovibrionales bacterium]|nr:ABC transporter substrate-binding protein [Bdellovibrionales bacterium]